jgi:hypothetical protein
MEHTVITCSGNEKTFDKYHRAFAIKVMCTECMGFEGSPKDCTAVRCPLYPFRGKTIKTLDHGTKNIQT